MKNCSYKTLLGVELVELSAKYLYELRNNRYKDSSVFKQLPQFTLNSLSHNQPIPAEYYLQFTGLNPDEENEKFLFFNLNPLENNLSEEISNCGVDEMFKDFDFKKILSKFVPMSEYDYSRHALLKTEFLVIQLDYFYGSDANGDYDSELVVNIVGYLDHNMKITYFENNEIIKIEK